MTELINNPTHELDLEFVRANGGIPDILEIDLMERANAIFEFSERLFLASYIKNMSSEK